MKVLENVLVEEVRFVEEEDGMDPLSTKLLHMCRDGIEYARGCRLGLESDCEAYLAIEISTSEGGILAIGETEACVGEAMTESSESAGLSDSRFADEQHMLTFSNGLDKLSDGRQA